MFRARLVGVSVALALVTLGGMSSATTLDGPPNLAPSLGISHLFDTWTGYQSGRFLSAVASADFNRDGYADVAWARQDFSNNAMNVQLNMGRGTMGPATAYPATAQSNDIAPGDLDRDGDADLVVVSQGNNLANTTIDVYINGNGTFTRRTAVGGSGPAKLALADLDGDTDLDLALTNYWMHPTGSVSVLLNNGAGIFGPEMQYPVGFRPNGVAAVDLDGDGDRDLAVARWVSGGSVDIHLFLNNGGGSFSPAQPLSIPFSAEDPVLASSDFDRDGDQDLAVAGARTDRVFVLLNQGNLSFSQQSYEAGFSSFNLQAADADADGDTDIVAATPGDEISSVSLLRNAGNGTFGPPLFIEAGYLPQDATVADFNKDGRPDLAVANRGTNTGSIHPQRANGSFANAALFDNDSFLPLAVASADFDGDGDVDVAESSDQVHVMTNQGNGSFVLSSSIPSGGGLIHGIVASDLNGDARPDLLWAPDDPPYPYVYALNNGNGSFAPIVVRNIQTCGTGDATTADVDNDGDQDVLVANNRSGPGQFCEEVSRTIRVARNNGDGTFQSDYGVVVFPLPQMAIGADLNRDGRTDLIAASAQISVALGTGGGQFGPPVVYDARGTELTSADPDSDGDLDVVTTDGSTATAYVLRNNGGGAFSQITPYPGEQITGLGNGFAIDIADLDGDQKLDLILANPTGNNVGVHRGRGDATFDLAQVRFGTHGCLTDVNVADYNRDGRPDLAGPACIGSSFVTPRGVQLLLNQRLPRRWGK